MKAIVSPLLAKVRRLALALPGVEESTSYGTPAFKLRGRLFARLHQDGESLVVAVDPLERELMLSTAPEIFFLTDHYLGYPWVQVHLSAVAPARLKRILEQARAVVAGKETPARRPVRARRRRS